MKTEVEAALKNNSLSLEAKYRLLAEMYDALNRYYQGVDTAALELVEQQFKADQEAIRLYGRLKAEAIGADGRVDVARINARAADIRNMRETQARLLAVYGSRGRSLWDSISRGAAQFTTDSQAQRTYLEQQVALADPNDPASHVLYEIAATKGITVPADNRSKAQTAYTAYERELQGLDTILMATRTGVSPQSVVAAIDVLTQSASEREAGKDARFQEARSAVLGADERGAALKKKIEELESSIDTLVSPTSQAKREWRLNGLTRDEAVDILEDPDFRQWAEARGLRLGETSDRGYIFSRGDVVALRAASRERRGLPVLHSGKPAATETTFQVARPADRMLAADQFSIEWDAETGKPKGKGYAIARDGAIIEINFAAEAGQPALRTIGQPSESGEIAWSSPKDRAAYEAAIENAPPGEFSLGNKPLDLGRIGDSDVRSSVTLDTLQRAVPTQEQEYGTIRGRVLPPNINDDPAKTRRILSINPDTNAQEEVVLKKDENGNWTVAQRTPVNVYGVQRKPKREARPDAEILSQQARRAGREVFGAQKTPGEIAAPDIPDTIFPAGEAVTAGLEGRIERREQSKDDAAQAARSGAEAARRVTPQEPQVTPQGRGGSKIADLLRRLRDREGRPTGAEERPTTPQPSAPPAQVAPPEATPTAAPAAPRKPSPAEVARATQMRPTPPAPGVNAPPFQAQVAQPPQVAPVPAPTNSIAPRTLRDLLRKGREAAAAKLPRRAEDKNPPEADVERNVSFDSIRLPPAPSGKVKMPPIQPPEAVTAAGIEEAMNNNSMSPLERRRFEEAMRGVQPDADATAILEAAGVAQPPKPTPSGSPVAYAKTQPVATPESQEWRKKRLLAALAKQIQK